ncbi:hypothetical protein ACEWY4_015027 [Coilia grayii]|uniref:LIM zinc-binding domain-containing protein n=1 Tax=Coilia grayii TaxID=363190 RepID=A0ABD1JTX2_9TELE
MVNPGGSTQPPPVGAGSLSWKRCAGCGGKIADRFLLYAMDSYWHSRCLKCSCCQAQLGEIGTSCYTKSGMILCRNDYIRNFCGVGRHVLTFGSANVARFLLTARSLARSLDYFTPRGAYGKGRAEGQQAAAGVFDDTRKLPGNFF